jgi:general stress protein YciG
VDGTRVAEKLGIKFAHISLLDRRAGCMRGGSVPARRILSVGSSDKFPNSSLVSSQRVTHMAEKGKRGFASMDQEKQRQIASKGGKIAHEKGRAHQFTSSEAREAGRKGGRAAHQRGKAHEFTTEEARQAGRRGGLASHNNTATLAENEEQPAIPEEPALTAEGGMPLGF